MCSYRRLIRSTVLLLGFNLALSACEKPAQTQTIPDSKKDSDTAEANRPRVQPGLDACSLITKEEAGAIQAAMMLDARTSENFDGTFPISQCYYQSKEPNMSVSFTLTEPDPGNRKVSPRNSWDQIFGRYRGGETEKEAERERQEAQEKNNAGQRGEEEGEKTPPTKIDGIGDEAFWSGNRFGGALYVLHKNYILRVSVGGPDKEEVRINKSRRLAEKAMSRL